MQSHTVTDENTGISIAEDEEQVKVTGLERHVPPDLLQSLQALMEIWKYDLKLDLSVSVLEA